MSTQEKPFTQPNYELSQIFFTPETVTSLVKLVESYKSICCLCVPTLAWALKALGHKVTLLEFDRRLSGQTRFVYYDIFNPRYVMGNFDCIFADPPHFDPALVKAAVNLLEHTADVALFLTFRENQEADVQSLFAEYGVFLTAFDLGYLCKEEALRHRPRLYANRSTDVGK